MTKKTVRFTSASTGGSRPSGPEADLESWVAGPDGAAFGAAPGSASATGGMPGFASAIGDAVERLASARTPADFALVQMRLARAGMQIGFLGAALLTQAWADTLRQGAAMVAPRED